MIYVTHDQVEAMTMADRIVVLRAGRVEQIGTPLELYNHPANRFVAGFIGSPQMNFLGGRVTSAGTGRCGDRGANVGAIRTLASVPGALGKEMTIGIRPEHVLQGNGWENRVTGSVVNVEQLGGLSYVHMTDPAMTVGLRGQTRVALGDRTEVSLPGEAIHVFDDGIGVNVPRVAPAHPVTRA